MKKLWSFFILISLFFSCQKEKYDLIIRNAKVITCDGLPSSFLQDVGVRGDTIAAIKISDEFNGISDNEVDAKGLVLSPGFIDTHSHHGYGLRNNPPSVATVSQGITTIIVGQDGGSEWPLKKYFQSLTDSPVVINVGSYSGHNTLRDHVLGNNFKRKATQVEIDSMVMLLKKDMDAGAFGLSTGLEYDPGIYSTKDEVFQLSNVLPQYRGRYISHMRSEDRYFWDALQEIIL